MIVLRNEQPSTGDTDRNSVDRTQQLFKNEDLEKLFLIVSSEFYHSWLGNIPNTLCVK